MSFKDLKERNVGSQEYVMMDIEEYPVQGWDKFKQFLIEDLVLNYSKVLELHLKL